LISPILVRILEEAKKWGEAGETFRVGFDLDSTLFEVTERNQRILEEFVESEHLENYPHIKKLLKEVRMQLSDHGLGMAIRRHYGDNLKDEKVKEQLIEYWKARFFTDEYLDIDTPFEGSVEYVRELHNLGTHIFYLTGRDVVRMGKGTPRQLTKWKFPHEEARAQLIMKPQKGLDDARFKTDQLKGLGKVDWFFENEPQIIHLVEEEIPEVKIVFFESSHSGKKDPKSEWLTIRSYKRT
jgi:hypothetical protein